MYWDTDHFFEMRAEDGIVDFDGRRGSSVSHVSCKFKFKFRSRHDRDGVRCGHKVPVIVGKTSSTQTSESFVSKE